MTSSDAETDSKPIIIIIIVIIIVINIVVSSGIQLQHFPFAPYQGPAIKGAPWGPYKGAPRRAQEKHWHLKAHEH